MMTFEEARQRVASQLAQSEELPPGDEWGVIDSATVEKPWGWVIFYTSKLWQDTGEIQYAVAGNPHG
ncbi:YrhB domain-containing protein [Roseateles depolymerans]|uniref:Immunity protein 35 domain-containing protein n=1 Tax=Roseateles depolymerans TaxID=76731 RepID=A0A0U3MIE9_9BURK|nr:YrhB domain-containing protein [Roseateles depolymerans]ALV08185.1 hypothetical protein RD2015_3731 [Roseateles depolymerans]REG21591.1 immunity protein 35 of polymorphic toxin system [Roseateles depolymerans]